VKPLRPAITVASFAMFDEEAELRKRGERVVSVDDTFAADGRIVIHTDAAHEFPVTIFGYSDEGEA
jgi:hypothetical protein